MKYSNREKWSQREREREREERERERERYRPGWTAYLFISGRCWLARCRCRGSSRCSGLPTKGNSLQSNIPFPLQSIRKCRLPYTAAYVQFFNFLMCVLLNCNFYLRAALWDMPRPESAKFLQLACNVLHNMHSKRCNTAKRKSGSSSASRSRGCVHVHVPAYRWVNFGSFAKACHGKSYYSGFLFFLEQQWAHKYYSLTKNQERTTLPSTTSDRQRARVKRKNVCKSKAWRDGANLKAHIASRSFPRDRPLLSMPAANPVKVWLMCNVSFAKPSGLFECGFW